MGQLERFARRLREEPGFSRNRRYEELSRPEARDMMRRLRRLDGIARELAAAESVAVQRDGTGYRLTLSVPSLRLRRETFLTIEEHALLRGAGADGV